MRILSYDNEKEYVCEKCRTRFAYNEDDVITNTNRYASVDSVRDFLKLKEFTSQLTKFQLEKLKRHKGWCINYYVKDRFVVCPRCKCKIELTPTLYCMEIAPQGTNFSNEMEFDENGGFTFYKFNPPTD